MTNEVIHDEKGNRFYINTEAGEAYVPYRVAGKNIDFYYSFVPPALRGQGVGRELVKACKAWAEGKGYNISASCGYVAMTLMRMNR